MSEKKCERITRREQRIARTRANRLLQDMRHSLKGKYKVTFRIAGSGCWGTMVKKPDGSYDLDYQIFITHNSKDYDIVLKDPKIVKNDIREAFNKNKNEGDSFKDSTTAITLINKQESVPYSIDFVIIINDNGKTKTIRQDKRSNPPRYFWNELPSKYDASYSYFKGLTWKEKEEITEIVRKRKCEKIYGKGSEDKSSSEILIEEINNYAHRKGDNL